MLAQPSIVMLPPAHGVAPRPISLDDLFPVPADLAQRLLRSLRGERDLFGPMRMVANAGTPGAGGTGAAPDAAAPKPLPEAQLSMEELVKEHADAVYRVALSVTSDPTLAEDVSQDALIKAWQSLPSYRGESPLRHWILRITHNTAISALRRRREVVVSPLDLPEGPAREPSVDAQVQDRIAIDRFQTALGDLDSISRSIVVLREVEGLSYAEMSDVLELPLPTIRTRLLRARRQLADALDGWQP
jgi:RNA polymerase sigma-70 factor (ECF subfamily)